MFTITDNLIIRPISPLFGLSVLNEMKVPFTDIEAQIVQVGKKEVSYCLYFLFDLSILPCHIAPTSFSSLLQLQVDCTF